MPYLVVLSLLSIIVFGALFLFARALYVAYRYAGRIVTESFNHAGAVYRLPKRWWWTDYVIVHAALLLWSVIALTSVVIVHAQHEDQCAANAHAVVDVLTTQQAIIDYQEQRIRKLEQPITAPVRADVSL